MLRNMTDKPVDQDKEEGALHQKVPVLPNQTNFLAMVNSETSLHPPYPTRG
jgi:hypothetical protein